MFHRSIADVSMADDELPKTGCQEFTGYSVVPTTVLIALLFVTYIEG